MCFALGQGRVSALSEQWNEDPAGSLIVSGVERNQIVQLARELQLDFEALDGAPENLIAVRPPRVGLYHTWRYTQDSGWARYTFEQLGIPFTLIDKDDLRAGDLEQRFDVIVVPNTGRLDLAGIVHGIDPRWEPMPYTQTDEFPSHGVVDSSPDITGGMGFQGLAELQAFVQAGGLLTCLGNAGTLAVDSGIVRDVGSQPAGGTPGSHITVKLLRPEHPVAWGYDKVDHVFHGNHRRFDTPERLMGRVVAQYGTKTMAAAEREADKKPGVPAQAPAAAEEDDESPGDKQSEAPSCLSGVVPDAAALERMPALLDIPVGRGHVLLFSWNPLHRYQNHHDFGWVVNALLFHDQLPGTPSESEMRAREQSN